MRAGLAASACDWPWSSAAAHVQPGTADRLLGLEWAEWFRGWDYAGWNDWLETGTPVVEAEAIRRATSTGEPLGSAAFLENLERQTGRRLRIGQRGRPRIISPVPFFT